MLREKIAKWYEGTWVPEDGSTLILGRVRRHWSATFARVLVAFWLAHWQWTIGFVLAVIGMWLSWQG
jgi:hypothetical protein